jgi:hypothetical protein
MPVPLVIAHGADYDLSDPVVDFIDANPPGVELIASIQVPRHLPSVPTRGSTATSVAIQMDAQVAIDLYRRIGLLAARMGWQLPP